MRRVLVDINIILDVLLEREPHFAASAAVWTAVEAGFVEGLLSAHAVPTIHYLARKQLGGAGARRVVTTLLNVFGVAAVDEAVIREALGFSPPDFEDSVTAAAARSAMCDLIVTRDPKGFRGSPVRALTPEATAHLLTQR